MASLGTRMGRVGGLFFFFNQDLCFCKLLFVEFEKEHFFAPRLLLQVFHHFFVRRCEDVHDVSSHFLRRSIWSDELTVVRESANRLCLQVMN